MFSTALSFLEHPSALADYFVVPKILESFFFFFQKYSSLVGRVKLLNEDRKYLTVTLLYDSLGLLLFFQMILNNH